VQGVVVGNCERCLSLSQCVTTAEANGYSVKSVGKITSDYTVNIDFKNVNILNELNSLKTELEKLFTPYIVETKIINSCTNNTSDLNESEVIGAFGKFKAIAAADSINGNKLLMKFIPGKLNSGGGKKIRILDMGDCGDIKADGVKTALQKLLGWAGCSAQIEINKPVSCANFNVEDIWFFIGDNRSKILHLIANTNYNEVISSGFISPSEHWFNSDASNPETTDKRDINEKTWFPISSGVGLISCSHDLSGWTTLLKSKSIAETVAFFCLHSLGHSAGIDHGPTKCSKTFASGFMASGNGIQNCMSKDPLCVSEPGDIDPKTGRQAYIGFGYKDIEMLIKGKFKNNNHPIQRYDTTIDELETICKFIK